MVSCPQNKTFIAKKVFMIYWILLHKAEEGCIKPNQCQVNSMWLELTCYLETLGALCRKDENILTILVHSRVEAFLQSTSPALIPMSLVNRASAFEVTLCFASIDTTSVNASFEEARASWKGFGFFFIAADSWQKIPNTG